MPTPTPVRLLLAITLVLAGPRLTAQQLQEVSLGKPTASSSEVFQVVSSVRELGPGRIAVADVLARRISLIDLERGTAKDIGRNGAGPGEFRAVERLIPRTDGSVLALDFYNRRLLPILPDGSIDNPIAFPRVSMQLQSMDATGRLYGEMAMSAAGKLSDSARVVRWDVQSGVVDTLLTFDAGRAGMMMRPGEAVRAWRNTAKWATLPNGDVIVVSGGDYRMAIWSGGKETKSVNLPVTRVRVTSDDKAAFRKIQDAKPVRSLNSGAVTGTAPKFNWEFPDTYPAFDSDAELLPSNDGNFWIARLGSPRDTVNRYDVISPRGQLVAYLLLPRNSRVAALGKASVYVVEKDADDVERIRRYAYPKFR